MDDRALEEAWSQVRAEWSNEARHRSFVDECRRRARLDVAARRYREAVEGDVADYRGERAADAERRLRNVVTLALASALVPTEKPSELRAAARTLSRFLFWALVLLALVVLVVRVLR